jgi:hypothetical protein
VVALAVEYVPTAHGVHVVEAVVEEYVPARQGEHVDTEEAPTAAEYVPALHAVHSDEPITSANVPSGHKVLTPFTQYVPTSHCVVVDVDVTESVPYDILKPVLYTSKFAESNVMIINSPGYTICVPAAPFPVPSYKKLPVYV